MPKIVLVRYDPVWPERFAEVGAALRAALTPLLGVRLAVVHHIGEDEAVVDAERDWAAVDDYADAKGDCVWGILREADRWSTYGWRSAPTDA